MNPKILFLFFILFNHNLLPKGIIHFSHPREALNIVKQYLPKNPTILEAGAYNGNDTIFMANFWKYPQIHAFEPVPELYEKLHQKVKKMSNIYTYPLAIGDKVGPAKMYISSFKKEPNIPSESSSLLKPKDHLVCAPHILFKKTITVQTTTFDEWAKKNNIDHIDMMWLDMQGYELNALMASPKILNTLKVILTEVEYTEAYQNQYQFDDVKQYLEKQGFKLIAENKECSWFGDAIFVKKKLIRNNNPILME